MSPYEQDILGFYNIYEENSDLFTYSDRMSLKALKSSFSEEDSIEKISDEIALWCENHPHILDVLLENPLGDTRARAPRGQTTRLTPKEALELLENIVRLSKPDSAPPSSQPQTPSKP